MTEHKMQCRDAKRAFREADEAGLVFAAPIPHEDGRRSLPAFEGHLENCNRCRDGYRLYRLGKGILRLGGASEPIIPANDWFVSLRARINREPAPTDRGGQEEPWQSALWQNARQLIPIMALLLLIVLGATLLWSTGSGSGRAADRSSVRASDRVFFNEVYEYPQPTTDDVLQTLVAIEDRPNGK
ncbi:MAG: hypothetical protein ACREDR_13875 [Blastocatellia bacterium]